MLLVAMPKFNEKPETHKPELLCKIPPTPTFPGLLRDKNF